MNCHFDEAQFVPICREGEICCTRIGISPLVEITESMHLSLTKQTKRKKI
jgi:hypothetical protein